MVLIFTLFTELWYGLKFDFTNFFNEFHSNGKLVRGVIALSLY